MAVLAECPGCHKKQAVKNKLCTCREDLVKAKRSNKVRYWISYRLPGGKQSREYVGLSIEKARDADGKRRSQKRENRIFEILPESKMTFQELTNWYLDLESVKEKRYYPVLQISLAKFNRVFGKRIVSEIKPSELEDYRAKRKKEGKAESTIDQEISAAKVVVNKAFLDDKVGGNVLKSFKNVKKYLTGAKRNSNQRTRLITPQEFIQLETSAPLHLKPILRAGYETGMREGEILKLKWGMVSLKDRVISLPKEITKDHEERIIPISDNLLEVLSRVPRGIREDYPVFAYKGKELHDIRTGLKKACTSAKVLYGRFKKDGFVYSRSQEDFLHGYEKGRGSGISNQVDHRPCQERSYRSVQSS